MVAARRRTVRCLGVVWWLVLVTDPGLAQTNPESVGDNVSALPGIVDVTMPDVGPARFAAALTGGYGYIEPINAADGDHHRLLGTLGLSVRPLEFLSAWFRMDGRYDMHPGGDESLVGDPRFGVRAGGEVAEGLRLGGDINLWLPGANAPDVDADAIGFGVLALVSYRPSGTGLTFALNAGYRLDQSRNTVDDPSRLRYGDQVSLGVSDAQHVIPIGLGASLREGIVEGLFEIRWDFMVDASALASPTQISLGARLHVFEGLQVEVMTRASFTERTDPATGVYLPIEPRFTAMLGLRYAFPFDGASAAETDATDEPVDAVDADDGGRIQGRVESADGAPIAGATIEASADAWSARAVSDGEGRFAIRNAPVGAVVLAVEAPEHTGAEQTVQVEAGGTAEAAFSLTSSAVRGELRGLVRDFRGRPVVGATVRIEQTDETVETDEDGTFQIQLPIGTYQVDIAADGFASQHREVEVEENAVTILNADLRRERR